MPQPWTLLRWQVEYLERVVDNGRTRPLVVRCSQIGVNPNPVQRSLLVKAVGLPEVTLPSLMRELFGNMLARELGVRTPTPALVDIDNDSADAREANPNCAIFENRLLAYDFEMAFSFLMSIGARFESWMVSKHGLASQHVMYPRLRRKSPSWEPLLTALGQLTEDRLDELMMHLPSEWHGDLPGIRTHVLSLLGALPEFHAELQESVA